MFTVIYHVVIICSWPSQKLTFECQKIAKNLAIFQKKRPFLASFFLHSNSNFPVGQTCSKFHASIPKYTIVAISSTTTNSWHNSIKVQNTRLKTHKRIYLMRDAVQSIGWRSFVQLMEPSLRKFAKIILFTKFAMLSLKLPLYWKIKDL